MAATFIHETAIIDDRVEIGEGVRVWHFCHVSRGARLGERCVLGQGVFIGSGVQIGRGVKIQNHVSVYAGVTVEDDVFLGPSCVFTNVLTPRAHIERKDEFAFTRVGKGSTIGANATIVCGHEIGEYAIVGAGAVVTRDVPAHGVFVGNPAHRIGWACRCGEILPLSGACVRCGDRYRIEEAVCEPL